MDIDTPLKDLRSLRRELIMRAETCDGLARGPHSGWAYKTDRRLDDALSSVYREICSRLDVIERNMVEAAMPKEAAS